MFVHTILPTKRSSILLPSNLVKSEMSKRTGKKFSGTIFYCPENPNGYNIIDPKIEGAIVSLIQQILCFTSDYILLFDIPELISKEDYKEMADIPGIDRVFIVNIGKSIAPVDKDYQLDASIFVQYFKKEDHSPKKRWLLTVDVKTEKDEQAPKKQKIEPISSFKEISSPVATLVATPIETPVSTPGLEGGRKTPTHPSNYWEEKDITRCAWSQEILPYHIEKLPAYKVYGISEIKSIPVPMDSKSHMICNYSNGKIYMNQRTRIQRSDFEKMTQLILSGCGRKVYAFNRVVGYYETDKMVYHHY